MTNQDQNPIKELITRDWLLEQANGLLDRKVIEMKERNGSSPMPVFILFKSDGEALETELPSAMMNSPKAKDALGKLIREAIKRFNVLAVLFLSDQYMSAKPMTREQTQSYRSSGLTLFAWCQQNNHPIREVICATGEAEGQIYVIARQFYRREGDGRTIILEERDAPDDYRAGDGRFAGFFPDPERDEVMRKLDEETGKV